MATANPARRDSRTADRPGPKEASPFRSSRPLKRMLAAEKMVAKRTAEIAKLEALLHRATDLAVQRRLTLRLRASVNNRASWLTYLADGYQKETRAVIIP